MQTVKIKIQLVQDQNIAMGPGKAELLIAIHQYGSISAAAKSMNMSYKRAWELVSVMNHGFKEPLVVTAVGGSHGGGATITAFGSQVLQHYLDLQKKAESFVFAEASGLLAMLV